MNRKINIFLCFIILTISFAFLGCEGSFVKVMYKGSNLGNQIKGSYQLFTGNETKIINFKKDETITINCESSVKKGTLEITLYDEDGNKLKEFKTGEKIEEQLSNSKAGKYKLLIHGEHTKGSFNISWKNTKN